MLRAGLLRGPTRPWVGRCSLRALSDRSSSTSSIHSSVASASALPDVDCLLEREWLVQDPSAPVTWVAPEGAAPFAIVRDDLTHPLLGGNKFRKLDGLWPQLRHATDVVTCGGLQSAHTMAVAAACAEHGIHAHLLVRGERPAVPTGHHLYTRMLGRVEYVSRADYADRQAMLDRYVEGLRQEAGGGQRQVAVIPEGAAQPEALLGTVRLVRWLAQESELAGRECHVLVDSGTGATATGLALGAALLGLDWSVTGIMLAGPADYYLQQQRALVEGFAQMFAQHVGSAATLQERVAGVLRWADRVQPRKFGRVLPGEVAQCREVAQRHGILLDPIWSLATWGAALALAGSSSSGGGVDGARSVVMLHTGGMLGLCGLAQRFPDQF